MEYQKRKKASTEFNAKALKKKNFVVNPEFRQRLQRNPLSRACIKVFMFPFCCWFWAEAKRTFFPIQWTGPLSFFFVPISA